MLDGFGVRYLMDKREERIEGRFDRGFEYDLGNKNFDAGAMCTKSDKK